MTVTTAQAAPGWRRDIDDVPAAVAVSGTLCAVAGEGGGVHLLDAASGLLLARLVLPGGVTRAAFSPDGAVVALAGPRGYALWRVGDGGVVMRTTGHPARFAWSPAGLCAVACGGEVRVYDASTGVEEWRPVDGGAPVDDLTWCESGTAVAVAAGGEVHLHGVRGRSAGWAYPVPVRVLAAAPAGAWLCSAGDGAGVYARGAGGTYEDLTAPGAGRVRALGLDDGGRYLAAGTDQALTVWDLTARGGRVRPRPRTLRTGAGAAVRVFAWRPGAAAPALAAGAADGSVAVWDPGAGPARRAARPFARWHAGAPVTALAWHGPGTLVHAARDGAVGARVVTAG